MNHRIFLLPLFAAWVFTACTPPRSFAPVQDATTASPIHVVKRGDTLYSIAWRYEKDYRTLATLNHLKPPYAVHVGQQIRVLQDGSVLPAGNQPLIQEALISEPMIQEPVVHGSVQQPLQAQPLTEIPVAQPQQIVTTQTAPASQPQSTAQKGGVGWRWPTSGPLLKRYTQGGHKGIDIAGQPGQIIYASSNGMVAYAGNGLRGYGNLIILKHNSEYLSAYAHNSELLVKEGQRVKVGDPIAKMGNTESAQTKLHFEIRRAGQTTNPLNYLPKSRV